VEFRPIKRPRIYEEIANQIRAQILGGRLRPGDRLPNERDLSATLGVSRPVLRQALAALETLGLIESRVGSGTFVSERSWTVGQLATLLTTQRGLVTEPLEVRRIIEPPIARLAAERATPAEIAEAASWIDAQAARVAAGESMVAEDTAFHDTLARAGGNELLVRLVEALHEMLRPSRERSLETPAGSRESLEWHRRILAAVVERDGQRAEAEMRAHLNSVEALILASLSGQERPPGRRRDGSLA
jgi:GntR family transcriptional repressor for pyruvate dehydrogenase complex